MKIVLASENKGKLAEIQAMLATLEWDCRPLSEFNCPPIEENGLSFRQNALIKARAASAHAGLPALSDDSGLCIDALDGEPGIYSARYAGEGRDFDANIDLILKKMEGVPKAHRSGHFHCVMAFVESAEDPEPLVVEARWQGSVLEAPRPGGGFGYDPIFYIPSLGCAVSALAAEHKNSISHRGQAMKEMKKFLEKRTAYRDRLPKGVITASSE